MNVGLVISGFWLGTFKFLFAHWLTYWTAVAIDHKAHFLEIFVSVTAGAWVSMAAFYFMSELFMKIAAKKRKEKYLESVKTGIPLKAKKKFTRVNKALVKLKTGIGIYGVTLIAPLLLSIPIGSIVCAKFFGHDRRTFFLMMINTAAYSAFMCFIIWLIQ
ncbi:MAG: hypothetical protein IPM74_00935 [Crocinitomicaceae bacterium]|nr:hypothetical protein [Crocinitomicaceae bacterium]MBK8924482.1 hypothetical protein [Crocinitomicaceae bacterium]